MQKNNSDEASEQLLAALKAEKEELEALLNREQLQTVQLKEEISHAENRNLELTKASPLSFMLGVTRAYSFKISSEPPL